jgi:hypothetical protein
MGTIREPWIQVLAGSQNNYTRKYYWASLFKADIPQTSPDTTAYKLNTDLGLRVKYVSDHPNKTTRRIRCSELDSQIIVLW